MNPDSFLGKVMVLTVIFQILTSGIKIWYFWQFWPSQDGASEDVLRRPAEAWPIRKFSDMIMVSLRRMKSIVTILPWKNGNRNRLKSKQYHFVTPYSKSFFSESESLGVRKRIESDLGTQTMNF